MKLYVASSYRNLPAVFALQDALRNAGHQILDWSAYAPPFPPSLTPEERKAIIDDPKHKEAALFCVRSCGYADALIYLGPAGQDAACEVGIAYAAGVPVLGIAALGEKPGLILAHCVARWFYDAAALIVFLDSREPRAWGAEPCPV